MRTKPREDKKVKNRMWEKQWEFDNNYLYYLYFLGWSKWWWPDALHHYEEARLYLYENKSQFVEVAKPGSIIIPEWSHWDCDIDMFMIIDSSYRKIFEDKEIKTSKSPKWEITGTKLERYYLPRQVYGHIRQTISNRIKDFLWAECKTQAEDNAIEIKEFFYHIDFVENMEWVKDKIVSDKIIKYLIPHLNELSKTDMAIFTSCILHGNSDSKISEKLKKQWISYSPYKVWKIIKEITESIVKRIEQWEFNTNKFI